MARELFEKFPLLKKELWSEEFWSDRYYVSTVSELKYWKGLGQGVKIKVKG